jgi:hypothetical protein
MTPVMQRVGYVWHGPVPNLSFFFAYLAMFPIAGASVAAVCLPLTFLQQVGWIDSLCSVRCFAFSLASVLV